MLRIVADIPIIRRIRRIRRIMFLGKIEEGLVIHKKDKIADIADRCGYSLHLADPADPADHVFRKNRKISSHPQERQNSRCCGSLRI